MEIDLDGLSDSLFAFRKQYPTITSRDMQTFILGWKSCNEYMSENYCIVKMDEQFDRELKELRAEIKKPNPDVEKIFRLLCGDKYNIPINERDRIK